MIKLTSHHLIYMTECGVRERLKLVPAHRLRVGQCVHTASRRNVDGHMVLRGARVEEVVEVN